MNSYQARKQHYLKTEAATERKLGNGRAEVFHEMAKLALNQGSIDEALVRNSVDLIDARRDCADFALAGVLRLLYLYHDGEAVNTALSAVDLVTYRTPDYQLSCAQDFRPGKPGYQQHPWHTALSPDAVVFTNHPGTDDESSDHLSRPNFWAGNRYLPRAAQHKNVLICIHHVPATDPRPYSHAYFPKVAFDEVVQNGHWVFGKKDNGYIALYAQTKAVWASEGDYKDIELRANARDIIWICEMGNAARHSSFEKFIAAIFSSRVECNGLRVSYDSPTLGKVEFSWTAPLCINHQDIPLHHYPRFDNPYIQTEFGQTKYHLKHGEKEFVI